jgi:hypothetical protein
VLSPNHRHTRHSSESRLLTARVVWVSPVWGTAPSSCLCHVVTGQSIAIASRYARSTVRSPSHQRTDPIFSRKSTLFTQATSSAFRLNKSNACKTASSRSLSDLPSLICSSHSAARWRWHPAVQPHQRALRKMQQEQPAATTVHRSGYGVCAAQGARSNCDTPPESASVKTNHQ